MTSAARYRSETEDSARAVLGRPRIPVGIGFAAPAFTFNVAVTLIGAFSAYDIIQATTGGGPGSSTRSINVLLRIQWGMGNFGTGSALGLIVTVMVIVVAVPLVGYLRRRET